jgi:ACS family hexuronate transporter-like MFS transporter
MNNGERKQDWRIWWPAIVMMLGTLLSYLDRQVLALLSPMILRDTHMNAQAYTEVISAFSFAYMFATPIWGSVLDRIGLRLGMTISIAIWTISSASHSLVSSFMGFAFARGALGLGEGAMFPGGFRAAMDSLPPDKQARGVAIAYSGSSSGTILAPLLLTPIAVVWGWRPVFLVTPLAALIWLLVWRLTVNPAKFPYRGRAVKMAFPDIRERRFWSLVASYALGALPVGAITYLAALYLSRAFGMTQGQLALVLWIPPAGLEAGYFFWGWISDRFARDNPRPAWLFAVLAVLALPGATTAWFHSASAAIALLTITMFASAGFILIALRTGAMAYPKAQHGMAAGIASSSFSLAVALILPVCGRLFDAHLYSRAFLIVAFMPLTGTLVWWLLTWGRTAVASVEAVESPIVEQV